MTPVQTAGAIATIAICLGALVWGGWKLRQESQVASKLDSETFCPKAGPSSVTVVLVDRTDGLTELQAEAVRRRLLVWAQKVPKHGMFEVYEVGRGGVLLDPVVSICNPGDGSDLSEFSANPTMAHRRYEEKYAEPIRMMAEAMKGDIEAPSSPILEALQAIAVRDFGPDASDGQKTLYIVSDLLQHGPALSFYHGVPDVEEFRKSPYGKSVLVQLEMVQISLYLLNRANAVSAQTDKLGEFWIHLLEEQGAIVEGFYRVPG